MVKLIRPSFGYSKMQVVASGEQGYVASEEIRPASSTLLAAATIPPADPMAAPPASPTAEQFNLNSDDPRLVPPPEAIAGSRSARAGSRTVTKYAVDGCRRRNAGSIFG